MLSVRLPADLQNQLNSYCSMHNIQKSTVVQTALRQHLEQSAVNPFLAIIGSGNGKYSTNQIMCLSRGEDWNQP